MAGDSYVGENAAHSDDYGPTLRVLFRSRLLGLTGLSGTRDRADEASVMRAHKHAHEDLLDDYFLQRADARARAMALTKISECHECEQRLNELFDLRIALEALEIVEGAELLV